ncbi:MAG: hypothetical protein H7328_04550 [Bdellovibrio sp.]|nr:hypothetical protein [Bdellovibrio sp.]
MKWILILAAAFTLAACSKGGGAAPSTTIAISIMPNSLIVPKSISTSIQVINTDPMTGTKDVTTQAVCTSNNPLATVINGQVSNNYTGSTVQLAQITCTYQGQSVTIPMTIVPAILQSLVLTKTSLTMAPGQSQAIQVYGNFVDNLTYVFALDMTNYVTWSSSASGVSSGNKGSISASSVGSANLTASFASQSVATGVTVTNGAATSSTPRGVGLTGTYYDFVGPIVQNGVMTDPFATLFGSRIDSQVYFNWSTGTNNLGQPLYFGICWTGRIFIPTTGTYTFFTQTDDGVRLWINDVQVIDNWTLHSSVEDSSGGIALTGGQFYNIRMDYFENAGYSQAELRWQGPSILKALIPQINLFPQ